MKNRAFTLVELAIVLAVIGILVGMGVGLVGILTKRAKYNEAKEIVNAAVESVINFAAFNNRLPTLSEFPSVVRKSKDPWGKDLVYFPASGLYDNSTNLCGAKVTNLKICLCTNATCNPCPQEIDNVAFAVVSGGLNYNVQTDNDSGIIKVYPYGTSGIDDYSGDFSRPEKYDDIVKWVTLPELQTKINCQIGNKGRLTILNNELPYGFVGSNYEATIYAEGGIPFTSGGKYEWCINGTLPPGISASPSTCWDQADELTLNGTPSQAGSYSITVSVRDNADPGGSNDNMAIRSFVITINPQQSGSGSGGGGPTGADVTFADLSNFVQTNSQGINADTAQGVVFLGLNTYGTSSCLWVPTPYQFDGNKRLRVYFEFKTLYVDTSSNSKSYGDGFTFALIGKNLGTSACQKNNLGEGLGFLNIGSPSAAVEFDFYPNVYQRWFIFYGTDKNVYFTTQRYTNHISVDVNGTVVHTFPFTGYPKTSSWDNPTWLEDGLWHKVRIEAWEENSKTCFKVWVDCNDEACKNLDELYNATPTLQKCVNTTFPNGFYAGFTEGTGGGTQNIELANFGLAVK